LVNGQFLEEEDIVDFLTMKWKVGIPELRQYLTTLVIVGMKTEAHF